MTRLEAAARKWLRENDWDYQKYGDRRQDRSAYDSLMNYEISGVLDDAFQAGAFWMREQAAQACGHPFYAATVRTLGTEPAEEAPDGQ